MIISKHLFKANKNTELKSFFEKVKYIKEESDKDQEELNLNFDIMSVEQIDLIHARKKRICDLSQEDWQRLFDKYKDKPFQKSPKKEAQVQPIC